MIASNLPGARQVGAHAPAVDQEALALARSLGQHEDILTRVESGKSHPAMIAYGLWREDDDLDSIMEEVVAQRRMRP